MAIIGVWAALLVIASIVEALLEYVFGVWWQPIADPEKRKKILMAVGLVLSILLCVWYRVDVISDIMSMVGFTAQAGIIGYILSGAIAGRGSEFVHSFILAITNIKNGGIGIAIAGPEQNTSAPPTTPATPTIPPAA